MHHATTTGIPARLPWLRWTAAILAAAILGIAAIQLARVDANLGAPYGPDRILRALDATPALVSTDATQARIALRTRPIDGAAYRVLAQAQDAAGHPDRATALYATAVARWPRERIARAMLADRAFAADDIDAGLHHVDALLRVAPTLRAAVLGTLMRNLGDQRIRQGLAARIAADPPWRDAVAPSLLDAATPTAQAEVLLAALAARTVLTPAELQARLALLDRLGQPTRARAIWLATLSHKDRQAAALVFDGGFERPGVVGGYAWQLAAPAGAALGYDTVDAYAGRSTLSIRFDGRAVQFAGVRQMLALAPGRYRLTMAVRNRVDTVRPFVWRLACAAGQPPVLGELAVPTHGGGDWQRIEVGFEVPSTCRSQDLQLQHT